MVEAGLTTDLTYDASGRLIQVTQTDTTTQTVPFSTAGRARTWSYTYGIGNLVTSVDGPQPGTADTATYTYNAQGYPETATDEVGNITRVTAWNGRGQPTSVTDPNGVATTYAYDPLGRLTAVVVEPGPTEARWAMTYTAAGDVRTVSEPKGALYTLTWDDARRLASIENNLGERVEYTRDAMGNATATVIKTSGGSLSLEESGVFDELGRLIRQVGGESRTWRFAYDRTGKLTGVTDPRDQVSSLADDVVGRLMREQERDGGLVEHAYNGKSEAVRYTDPRNLETLYVRNGFGEVIQETSPDRGVTIMDQDERGLMISRFDEGNQDLCLRRRGPADPAQLPRCHARRDARLRCDGGRECRPRAADPDGGCRRDHRSRL